MDLELIAHEIVRLIRGLALLLLSSVVMLGSLVIVVIGACFAVMGAGTPLYQSILWLQEGRWHPFTNAYMLGPQPRSTWVGVDEIIRWVWDLPLTLGALLAGLAIMALGAAVGGMGLTIRKRLDDQLRERSS